MTGLENIINEFLKEYKIRREVLWEIMEHVSGNLESYEEVEHYINDEISELSGKINENRAYIKDLPKKSAEMQHIDNIYLKVKSLLNF